MTDVIADKLAELIAREEIRALVLDYCAAADRVDLPLLESVYHDDALDEHGMNPSGTAREFLDMVPGSSKGIHMLEHHVTNHRISVDGDVAEGEVYHVAYHSFDPPEGSPKLLITGGRYLDRYTRRDGVWRIAHRRCVRDFAHEFPVSSLQMKDAITGGRLALGRTGPDDPSYDFFTLLRRGERVSIARRSDG